MSDPKTAKTVLILGGGAGGIVAANTLRKLLPRQYRIVVIDQEDKHLFASSLLWVMVGMRREDQIVRPLDRLNRKGIDFIKGRIEKINPEAKSVQVSGREFSGHAMIVSLGADLVPENIPGLKEAGRNIYTLDGATAIYKDLMAFQGGKIVILTANPVYKCPAAPYEAAMLIEYFCRKHGIRSKTEIVLYAAEPGPMGTAGPEVSSAVRQMVESKGIKYYPTHQVTEVDPKIKRIMFSGGLTANFDLLFFVPPHRAPEVVKQAGLLGENGWGVVDRNTLQTKYKDIYAIGDVVAIPLKMGKPLPKAGVFAHAEAEIVARNIARQWTRNQGEASSFNGHGQCFIEIGDHRAGLGSGNFYAEPTPTVKIKAPGIAWHLLKLLFEKYWLTRWF